MRLAAALVCLTGTVVLFCALTCAVARRWRKP